LAISIARDVVASTDGWSDFLEQAASRHRPARHRHSILMSILCIAFMETLEAEYRAVVGERIVRDPKRAVKNAAVEAKERN
jgi:hypothetical protein